MKPRTVLLAALAPLAACAPAAESEPPASRAPAATVTGEPVSCIDASRIDNTRVWDDATIDFEMLNNTTYRNTLPVSCPSLGFEERFGYKLSTGHLCSGDIIHVLYSDGREGAACGLGKFVPVKVEKH
jgi:hypothetical protein